VEKIMKLSRLYKCAIILILVVFVASFSIEQADAKRRRRVQCSSTGKVTVAIRYGTPTIQKVYTSNRGGCCGVRGERCVYVGPSGQTLLDEWVKGHPADAKTVAANMKPYWESGPQMKAEAYIECKCESTEKMIQSGGLSRTSTGLSFGPWQR